MSIQHQIRALLVAVMPAAAALAGDKPEFSGYYKFLLSAAHAEDSYGELGVADKDWLFDNFERFRLKMDYAPRTNIALRAHYEVLAWWGDSVRVQRRLRELSAETSPLAGALSPEPRRRFMDLDDVATDDGNFRLSHGLDRLQLRLLSPRTELSVGRQAVSWGTGLLWNPTDLFSSFSPTEIDRDEKLGVDVVRLMLYPTYHTSVDVIAEPLDNDKPYAVRSRDSSLATRMTGHAGEYDLSLCGGSVAGDGVLGGDFSGYILNAGFRGEALYTWVDEADQRDYFRGLVSVDYSFSAPWDPYLAFEYFYNGLGAGEEADYLERLSESSVARVFQRGTAFNLGRHYLGSILRLAPASLVQVQAITLWNILDRGVREFVSVTWSRSDSSEVILSADVGLGPLGSEFVGWSKEQAGAEFRTPDLYFLYWKWHF
ncbi:MAG: hypothetical protein KKC51_01810 [Verrucomicrobia bacterium]|nr:hypothetical protein [Verrucomicrobiota bacterium]